MFFQCFTRNLEQLDLTGNHVTALKSGSLAGLEGLKALGIHTKLDLRPLYFKGTENSSDPSLSHRDRSADFSILFKERGVFLFHEHRARFIVCGGGAEVFFVAFIKLQSMKVQFVILPLYRCTVIVVMTQKYAYLYLLAILLSYLAW